MSTHVCSSGDGTNRHNTVPSLWTFTFMRRVTSSSLTLFRSLTTISLKTSVSDVLTRLSIVTHTRGLPGGNLHYPSGVVSWSKGYYQASFWYLGGIDWFDDWAFGLDYQALWWSDRELKSSRNDLIIKSFDTIILIISDSAMWKRLQNVYSQIKQTRLKPLSQSISRCHWDSERMGRKSIKYKYNEDTCLAKGDVRLVLAVVVAFWKVRHRRLDAKHCVNLVRSR